MTYTDDDLTALVREHVARRPGGRADLDQVLGRGRRRVAVRRAVTAGVAAAVLAGGAAVALGPGLPLLSSAPPAAPSVTLTPDPRRTEALRPVTDMYEIGERAARGAGLEEPDGWSVSRDDVTFDGTLVYDGSVQVTAATRSYVLSSAHAPSLDDPGATSCADVTNRPLDCTREPQEDGAVLFTLAVGTDGEPAGYLLVHGTGVVSAYHQEVRVPRLPDPEPVPTERLRALVLDPTLRW